MGTQTAGRLTDSRTGELDLARAHLVTLVIAARGVTAASGHAPERASCAEAGCPLATVPDGPAWCRLAHRLARLDVAAAPDAAAPTPEPLPRALDGFRDALLASLDAVRTCRSIAHAEGTCWFADHAGVDVCGDVLRLAHRAG